MSDQHVEDAVVVRASVRAQLPPLVAVGLFAGGYAVLGLAGVIGRPLAVAGIVVFGAVMLTGVVGLWKTSKSPWELRLDGEGVTVRGHETVSWVDVTEVRVTGMRPKWIFWASKFMGYRMISFFARPGIELPPSPSFSYKSSFERHAGNMRARWYGSRLVIMPRTTNLSTAAITAAVQRFGHVPITYS